jgi:hypothetical protein
LTIFWENKKLTALFIIFAVAYLGLSLFLSPDQAVLHKYHVTSIQLKELQAVIAVPYLLIWFVALTGYLNLKKYANSIRDDLDGRAYTVLANGVLLLTLWLPINVLFSSLSTHINSHQPALTPNMVRLGNYVGLILLTTAFYLLYRGSLQLVQTLKRSPRYNPDRLFVIYAAFAAVYTYLVFHDPAREVATRYTAVAVYYTTDWVTLLTIVIPRLIGWYFGMRAIVNIHLFMKNVKGVLYREALNSLVKGLTVILTAMILLRIIQSFTMTVSRLNLGLILLIVFSLLFIIALGYGLLAKGAHKLRRLEEL